MKLPFPTILYWNYLITSLSSHWTLISSRAVTILQYLLYNKYSVNVSWLKKKRMKVNEWSSESVMRWLNLGFFQVSFYVKTWHPLQLPSLSCLSFLDGEKIKLSLWLLVALVIGLTGLGVAQLMILIKVWFQYCNNLRVGCDFFFQFQRCLWL